MSRSIFFATETNKHSVSDAQNHFFPCFLQVILTLLHNSAQHNNFTQRITHTLKNDEGKANIDHFLNILCLVLI